MQLNQISSDKTQKEKRRVGRGGSRGTFRAAALKGKKARAGRKLRPEWRDALKRIPKRRGYKFKSIHQKALILNLPELNEQFKENELVTVESLFKKGLVGKIKGRLPEVKILGNGELNKKIDFKGLKFSVSAKEKIEKAGGKISQ